MDEIDHVVDVLREVSREAVTPGTLLVWGRCRDRGIDLSAALLAAARERFTKDGPDTPVGPPGPPAG
jgi:hypothetical protein